MAKCKNVFTIKCVYIYLDRCITRTRPLFIHLTIFTDKCKNVKMYECKKLFYHFPDECCILKSRHFFDVLDEELLRFFRSAVDRQGRGVVSDGV